MLTLAVVRDCCWVCEHFDYSFECKDETVTYRCFFYCKLTKDEIFYEDAFSSRCEEFKLKKELMPEQKDKGKFPHECMKLVVLLEEFMEYVDNPYLSIVKEACDLLGHPIKDEKGCYCRIVKIREVDE